MLPARIHTRLTILLALLVITILGALAWFNQGAFEQGLRQIATVGGADRTCTQDGATILSGKQGTFYLTPSVPTGSTCASVAQVRTCNAGVLSGPDNYTYKSCWVDSSLPNIKKKLGNFLPFVWATTWYPWFNNNDGVDPANRGLTLFKSHIKTIKAQGFNTVWIGGNFPWNYFQPTAGVWNEEAVTTLKSYLQVLRENNMRAIFQLNYVGPGFSPSGIHACNWMSNPTQVQQFTDFATGLGGRLASYNYMIYYMVYTEQTPSCLVARGQENVYKGIRLNADGTSTAVDPVTQAPEQQQDVQSLNTLLQNSIGGFTKDIPKALRDQMYIGIHDAYVSEGQISGASAIEAPNDFDYFSFVYYPSYPEVAAFPSESAIATQGTTASNALKNRFDTARSRVLALHPGMPLLLGEFGWPAWDPQASQPVFRAESPARDLAYKTMLDWSIAKKIGFNVWGWVPRYIDDPTKNDPYDAGLSLTVVDEKILSTNPTFASVMKVIRARLTGSEERASCTFNGNTIASGSSVTAYAESAVPAGSYCQSQTRTCQDGVLSGSYAQASCAVASQTTSLSSSCDASGVSSTFTWSATPGATAYYLNVYNSTTKEYVYGPNKIATNPVTVKTMPGNTYTSWVYVVTSAGWSSAIGAKPLVCAIASTAPTQETAPPEEPMDTADIPQAEN